MPSQKSNGPGSGHRARHRHIGRQVDSAEFFDMTIGADALGDQLDGMLVLTTATKMGRIRTDGNHVLFDPDDSALSDALARHRTVLAWSGDAGHKAIGVAPEACDRSFALADHVVVEADGSRQRLFTAPNPFEPVVPSLTTLLVACVGASAFDRVIADQCHRPMRVAGVAGCSPSQRLTPERLAAVLLSERGTRKGCPPDARCVVVVNQVTDADHRFVDQLIDVIDGQAPFVAVAAAA